MHEEEDGQLIRNMFSYKSVQPNASVNTSALVDSASSTCKDERKQGKYDENFSD